MERHDPDDVFAAMQQDHFTVEELADVSLVDRHLIERAAFSGDLRATIIDHHIVRIDRDDAIAWLRSRDA